MRQDAEHPTWATVDADFGGATPFLTLDDLRVERGPADDAFVLEIERLRIPSGSFTAILGGSGIGKTTLLSVLGLLRGPRDEPDLRMHCERFAFVGEGGSEELVVYEGLTPSAARVELPARERERLRREWIGFCLQGGELLPSLTLADNCAVPAHLCSLGDADERSVEVLGALGMVDSAFGNQLGKLPGELSGGQRQRGVVARALTHSPRVVLLDEPTAGLDRGTAEEAVGLLRDLARSHGQTVIMVTHDRGLAEDYADFVVDIDLVEKKHSRIQRCRARKRDDAGADTETDAASAAAVASAAARSPTSWRYHVRLGLMDALGPLFHAFAPGKRASTVLPAPSASGLRFAWQLVQNSAVVVAIAMLVLFLRGMRSGMIEDFRQALRTSPTARKITLFGSFQQGDIEAIEASHPLIEQVVPVATPRVAVSTVTATERPDDDSPLARVTLQAIVTGDPGLRLLEARKNLDAMPRDALVVSEAMAELLGVKEGGGVGVWVERQLDERGEVRDARRTVMRVYEVLPGADRSAAVAWAHFGFTRDISRFLEGLAVEALDWPAVKKRLSPRYTAFLLFVRAPRDGSAVLPRHDEDVLRERSFKVERLDEDAARALLAPLLRTAEAMAALNESEVAAGRKPYEDLVVYRCVSQRGELLRSTQLNTESILDCSGLLVPWNEPLRASTPEGTDLSLLGFSMERKINWLRPYLRSERFAFTHRDTSWTCAAADGQAADGPRPLRLATANGDVELTLDGLAVASEVERGAVGVVSSQLLGRLHAVVAGIALADTERKLIHRVAAPEEFGELHVFPDDVFAVPEIVASLGASGYPVVANTDRLREIQGYTHVLGYIVRVTSVLAGIIALLTIAIVFHDVGKSKKRILATLRIMGLTRGGAFTLLMVRAVLVALIAGLLLVVVGAVGSATLNALAGRRLCLLGFEDYLLVLVGILVICTAGVYLPARAVSRIEPVVALQEAEQRG